jgi:1,4-alpha-glucan branching enzyme
LSGTFSERISELKRQVGAPDKLEMTVIVDQVYAHAQHEHMEYRHPRGGQAKYLERGLYDHYREYYADYGHDVLRDGGQRSLARSAEHLSDQVEILAPREWFDLGRSGHPVVTQGERTLHDRPPHVRRLTEAELKAKSRLRMRALQAAGLPWFFTRDGKVIRVPGRGDRR